MVFERAQDDGPAGAHDAAGLRAAFVALLAGLLVAIGLVAAAVAVAREAPAAVPPAPAAGESRSGPAPAAAAGAGAAGARPGPTGRPCRCTWSR